MKLHWMTLLAGLALFISCATGASASDTGFAIQGSVGDNSDLGAGARFLFDLGDASDGLGGYASFDYFFPGGDRDYWELNGNLTYTLRGSLRPYLGGGLNVAADSHEGNGDGSTDLGLNLLGGVKFSRHVFGEARVELGGGEQFVATVGVIF